MPMGSASANAATTGTAEKQAAIVNVRRQVMTLVSGLDEAFDLLDRTDEIKRMHEQAKLDAAEAAKDRTEAADILVKARGEAIRIHTDAQDEADRTRAKVDADFTDIRKRLEAEKKVFADEMAAQSADMSHRQANQDMRENILQDMEAHLKRREAEIAAREADVKRREDAVVAAEAAAADKARAVDELRQRLAS